MAGRFIIIVLDGFGVGEMPDVADVRPGDAGSDTCGHIFQARPSLRLPVLERLGLANIMGGRLGNLQPSPSARFGKAQLMHFGADTFSGHQEIMGTLPRPPHKQAFCMIIDEVEASLASAGFEVRRHARQGCELLIVDNSVTIADNIECDPGQAINVTAAIDDIPFQRVLDIGRLVRNISKAARVISFGGRGVHLDNLLSAVEVHGEYIGVNAPGSGVYNDDYHCIHMAYGVDENVQAPTILGKMGIPVFLLGKVADVVVNAFGTSIPMVDTAGVLARTKELLQQNTSGFFCTNVQETDLCGHRENIDEYAKILAIADKGIGDIIPVLNEEDILIVMADHGNDPAIGHPHHTREMVPLMIYRQGMASMMDIGIRSTLSDVGATACDYFHATSPENGESFLPESI